MKNLRIEHICFDLDGTLIDSRLTIYNSTVKSLKEFGINVKLDQEEFSSRIGHHFNDIFRELNLPPVDFDEFIEVYKSVYFNFIDESTCYPELNQTLNFLKQKKIKISLLTTKGQSQADKIIDHFKLSSYFDEVMGRREGIAHKPSAEPLLKICDFLSASNKKTLMVGDTELDIRCGKSADAFTCAALYGYRTTEQLQKEKPDFTISGLDELKNLFK